MRLVYHDNKRAFFRRTDGDGDGFWVVETGTLKWYAWNTKTESDPSMQSTRAREAALAVLSYPREQK